MKYIFSKGIIRIDDSVYVALDQERPDYEQNVLLIVNRNFRNTQSTVAEDKECAKKKKKPAHR